MDVVWFSSPRTRFVLRQNHMRVGDDGADILKPTCF